MQRVWPPDRRHVAAMLFVGFLYPLVGVAGRAVGSSFSSPVLTAVDATAALPIPLVLAMGPIALLGIPLGSVLGDLATNSLGPGTAIGVTVHLFLGYAASRIARLRGFGGPGIPPGGDRITALRRGAVVVGVSTLGAAAVYGWMSELFHRTPFYVATPLAFLELVVVNAVLAAPLLWLIRVVTVRAGIVLGGERSGELPRVRRFSLAAVTTVAVAWSVVGVVGSVGYRLFERIPPEFFVRRNLDALTLLQRPALFGAGAGRVQVLFGAVMCSLLLAVLLGHHPAYGVDTG